MRCLELRDRENRSIISISLPVNAGMTDNFISNSSSKVNSAFIFVECLNLNICQEH